MGCGRNKSTVLRVFHINGQVLLNCKINLEVINNSDEKYYIVAGTELWVAEETFRFFST